MRRFATCLVLACAVLVGCSKPKETVIPSDISAWDKDLAPALKKLDDEERQLFAAYMLRAKMGEAFEGKAMPPGMTVGAAIAEQRAFQEKQALAAAEAKAAAEKIKAQREAAAEQMRQAVSVALVSKKIEVERGYSGMEMDRHLTISFVYKNLGRKDIAGVKGMITIKDLFGDQISAFYISNDETIKVGGASVWSGSRSVKFTAGRDNKDEKLAELADDKFSLDWQPEVIVFSDGTKLSAPR